MQVMGLVTLIIFLILVALVYIIRGFARSYGFKKEHLPTMNTQKCYVHNNSPSVDSCAWCGNYYCSDCSTMINEKWNTSRSSTSGKVRTTTTTTYTQGKVICSLCDLWFKEPKKKLGPNGHSVSGGKPPGDQRAVLNKANLSEEGEKNLFELRDISLHYWWFNDPRGMRIPKNFTVVAIVITVILGAINYFEGGFDQLTLVYQDPRLMWPTLIFQAALVLWTGLVFIHYMKKISLMRKRWNAVRIFMGQDQIEFKPMFLFNEPNPNETVDKKVD